MSDFPVRVTLSITVKDDTVSAHLVFRNHAAKPAFLYKPNICEDGNVDNNVFVIFADGRRVKYKGKYVKRPAPSPQDYLELRGQEEFQTTVPLGQYYALEPAGSTFHAHYEAMHGSPLDRAVLWEVKSNEAVFRRGP